MEAKDLYQINIAESQNDHFRRSTLAENFQRGKILAIVMIIFDIVLAGVDISAAILKLDGRFHFSYYLIMYVLMILINGIYLLYIKRVGNIENKSIAQLRNLEIGLLVYITLIISWGSIVSLMDQKLYGQLMVFMVNMIICSVIYYLDHKKIMIPYVCSVLILLIGLPFFQDSNDILIGHYVNLSVFIIISWLASRIIFLSYYRDYKSNKMLQETNLILERKILENTVINSKLAALNLQLNELALIDELTGIPNRRSFRNHIDLGFERYVKDNSTLSIIMLDIDYFKQFNDIYGHNAGDKILRAVANQVNSVVRHDMDFVARWGGEEFIYGAFNSSAEEIERIAEAILSKVYDLKVPHRSSKKWGYITVSIGICTLKVNGKVDVSKCIEGADKALYLAKSQGRNCVRLTMPS
ncbi:diguanylate cyclase domain-containing protein [Desulfosporosinus meridiei]|uniref:Diguanylate cyclase (GGDEF) domain-containing protein n=1 Tax=Desulfosporosinus meridiei (strain ATCC BAA-275 / DSM 13257 / KCTC 12902 / NCIMB 13706 / S10) TaxID=768704 RepID=J7IZ36_DESMD|nr:diguanylate cyclase [Desulfosporosinus meridiei]AFQ44308.1 diguanylate cyclase (GGDEF) domain-containing protein [Desulfosporosinus meridiei DSM 13257]